jgi:hypothetical protein
MGAIPFALSVHHFISTVGADAGFAAIIGLAILVLLFFSQARETATLRRRAAESDEQLHRLELYVDQLSRSSASSPRVGVPAPAPTGVAQPAMAVRAGVGSPLPSRTMVPVPAPVGAVARAPGAPAGVGAPALNAATRLIPVADPISIRSLKPAGTGDGAQPREAGAVVMAPPSPAPSTAAGGANGTGIPRVAPPPLATAGGGSQPPPRVALRPNGPPSRPPLSSSTARRGGGSGGSRVSRVAVAVATVLVVVIAVAVLLLVTSNNGSPPTTASHATQTTSAPKKKSRHPGKATAAAVAPASITVAVLNGTSTTNLAHDTMARLTAAGYKQGLITTASDQTLTSTIVGFTSAGYRRDALAVAKSLKLGSASVQAVDQGSRVVVCSATPTACPTQVVVTVGSDLAPNA